MSEVVVDVMWNQADAGSYSVYKNKTLIQAAEFKHEHAQVVKRFNSYAPPYATSPKHLRYPAKALTYWDTIAK